MSLKNFHMIVVPPGRLYDDRFQDWHHFDIAKKGANPTINFVTGAVIEAYKTDKDNKQYVDFPDCTFRIDGHAYQGSDLFCAKYHFDDDVIIVRGRGSSDIPTKVRKRIIEQVIDSYGITTRTKFYTQPRGEHDLKSLTELPFKVEDFLERPDDNRRRVEKVCAYFQGLEPIHQVFDYSNLKIEAITTAVLGSSAKKHTKWQDLSSALWRTKGERENAITAENGNTLTLDEPGLYQSAFAQLRAEYVVGVLRGAVSLAEA